MIETRGNSQEWQGKHSSHSEPGAPQTAALAVNIGFRRIRSLGLRLKLGTQRCSYREQAQRKAPGNVIEASRIVHSPVDKDVLQKTPGSKNAERIEKLPVKSFPGAFAFPIKHSQGDQRHAVLGQCKDVVRRVVVGVALNNKLPRQSKIEIQAHPPEEQKEKVQAAKSQVLRCGLGLRPKRQRGQRWNQR